MKTAAIALLVLAEIGTGQATGARVTARQLVDDPDAYFGKTIVVPNIGCVDAPKSGFLCVAIVEGQVLRIDASVLGAKTRLAIAERLAGGCKGTANLTRAACRVDAEIEPTSSERDMMDTASGSMPVTVVFTQQIEMYAPRRR